MSPNFLSPLMAIFISFGILVPLANADMGTYPPFTFKCTLPSKEQCKVICPIPGNQNLSIEKSGYSYLQLRPFYNSLSVINAFREDINQLSPGDSFIIQENICLFEGFILLPPKEIIPSNQEEHPNYSEKSKINF